MNTTVTLDKAGRVVIPKSLRDELHLEAGDSLELVLDGDRLTLRPVRTGSALRKVLGVWVFRRNGTTIFAETTTQVLESVRNERDRDNRGLARMKSFLDTSVRVSPLSAYQNRTT